MVSHFLFDQNPAGIGRLTKLVPGRLSIGRGRHNELVIDDVSVSVEHAAITLDGEEALLEDLNSTNGTKVNGQPVHTHYLQDGDSIALGSYCLRFNTIAVPLNPFGFNLPGQMEIQVVDGPRSGSSVVLREEVTSVGANDEYFLVVRGENLGYRVLRETGAAPMLVNDVPIATATFEITEGDAIVFGGTTMRLVRS